MPDEYTGLGKCVDRTLAESMEGFANRYYKGQDTASVVALYVKDVVLWGTLRRGGQISIQVSTHGIEDPKGFTVASEYRRKAKGKYVLRSEEVIS